MIVNCYLCSQSSGIGSLGADSDNKIKIFLVRELSLLHYLIMPIFLHVSYIVFKKHCGKSVHIRSYFWSLFLFGLNTETYGVDPHIQSEYRKIRARNNSVIGHFSRIGSKSPYSVQIQENTDQKPLRILTIFTQRNI